MTPKIDFTRVFAQLHAEAWLIDPIAHASLVTIIERLSLPSMAGWLEQIFKQHEERPAMSVADGVAEIRLEGPIIRGAGFVEKVLLGATDPADAAANFAQAAGRPDVRAVLLNVDSPGGTIGGIPELAAQVRALAEKKPVVAFTEGTMASAAYWVASQARSIIATPSANIGSIGVYIPWSDTSKRAEMLGIKVGVVKNAGGDFKGMGHPGTAYTPEQIEHLQQRADELFGMFKSAVTSSRRRVQPDAMRGQTMYGNSARAAGLVDAVDSQIAAWNKAFTMGNGSAAPMAIAPQTSDEAKEEFARLNSEGKSHEASRFYAEHRALILAR